MSLSTQFDDTELLWLDTVNGHEVRCYGKPNDTVFYTITGKFVSGLHVHETLDEAVRDCFLKVEG